MQLQCPMIAAAIKSVLTNPSPPSLYKTNVVVGIAGLEPTTSWPQTRRPTSWAKFRNIVWGLDKVPRPQTALSWMPKWGSNP